MYMKPLYIYIYIYLLIYRLPAFTVTKKKKIKTLPKFRDNKPQITAWGKKKKVIGRKKEKEKANFVTPVEKKSRNMQSVDQKNKNPPQTAACYNYKKCSILNRANYKN